MSIEDIAVQIAQTIQKEANINAIFGEPKKLDEHTIIPVARVQISLGAGGGGGMGPAPAAKSESDDATSTAAHGTGGGGGLEIDVRPLGFIRDGADGAEFVAIDPTPEGLLSKVEHLLKGIRAGQKPAGEG